jgi:hypothetical protein
MTLAPSWWDVSLDSVFDVSSQMWIEERNARHLRSVRSMGQGDFENIAFAVERQ